MVNYNMAVRVHFLQCIESQMCGVYYKWVQVFVIVQWLDSDFVDHDGAWPITVSDENDIGRQWSGGVLFEATGNNEVISFTHEVAHIVQTFCDGHFVSSDMSNWFDQRITHVD